MGILGQQGGGGGILGGQAFQGLRDFWNSDAVLPAAAAMIAAPTFSQSLAGGFAAAAPGMVASRKRMLWNNWLKAGAPKDPNDPSFAALIADSPAAADKVLEYQLTKGAGGAYNGDSMDAQNWNVILRGQTDSPQYAAAYSQLFETPKMAPGQGPNGEITQTPYYPNPPQGVKPPAGYGAAAQSGGPAVVAGGGGVRTAAPIVTGQKPPNEQNIRNRELYSVASQELPIVEKNFDALADPANQAAGLGGDMTRWMASPGYQQAFMSLQTIVASYLYSTSGATANPGEVIKQTQVLMPAPFESAASVADKKARVRRMVEAIKMGAQTTGGGDPAAEPAPEAAPAAGWTQFDTPKGPLKIREKPQ